MPMQDGVLTFDVTPSATQHTTPGQSISFTAAWTVDDEAIVSPPYEWAFVQWIRETGGEETIVAAFGPLDLSEQPIARSVPFPSPGNYEVFCRLVPPSGSVSESNHVTVGVSSNIVTCGFETREVDCFFEDRAVTVGFESRDAEATFEEREVTCGFETREVTAEFDV